MEISTLAQQDRLMRSLERQTKRERPQPKRAELGDNKTINLEAVSPTTGHALIMPLSGLQARHMQSIEKFRNKETENEDPAQKVKNTPAAKAR